LVLLLLLFLILLLFCYYYQWEYLVILLLLLGRYAEAYVVWSSAYIVIVRNWFFWNNSDESVPNRTKSCTHACWSRWEADLDFFGAIGPT